MLQFILNGFVYEIIDCYSGTCCKCSYTGMKL